MQANDDQKEPPEKANATAEGSFEFWKMKRNSLILAPQ
jgi:hypothetical protein